MDRIPANVAIDIDSDIIRERSNSSSSISSRSTSIVSKVSSMSYHKMIEINNSLLDKEFVNLINSSQLSYKDNDGAGNLVRKTTDTDFIRNQQCIQDESIASKNISTAQGKSTSQHYANMSQSDDVINISILYDPNQPTESEYWDKIFYSVFLYGLLEYLLSDAKNIKKSLIQTKYIENKKIDTSKFNNVAELLTNLISRC